MQTIKKSSRVVHIVSGLSGGGIGSVVMNYYSGISNSIVFDVVVNRIVGSAEEQEIIRRGGRVLEVNPLREGFFKYVKSVFAVLRTEQGSIIHCHLGEKSFFFLLAAFFLGYKKRILHVHSAERPESRKEKIQRKVFTFMCKTLATDYFACGEEAAKWFYGSSGNVKILKNAIHIRNYQFSEELRQHYRDLLNAGDRIVLANVGRLSPPKNHEFLLSVFKEVHNKNKNTLLVLVGAGELEGEIRNLISEKDLEDSVIMYGISNNVNELLNAFDIIVMPSISEGVPVAAIEALSNGLFVLCSDAITKEIRINTRVDYLPLKLSPSSWADKILGSDFSRRDVANKLETMGFSIEKQSALLEQYYLND